jgi:thiosulfate/3-mercaptopyruvate sulfurtransferase
MVQLKRHTTHDHIAMKWLGPEKFDDLLQKDPIILDCQPDVHDYVHRHIDGSVYVNEESFRLSRWGRPHAWIPGKLAQLILRQLGIDNDRPVAIYGSLGESLDNDGMAQMVVAYSLARYGHRDITILDGGLERWKEASMPLTKAATKTKLGDFKVHLHQEFIISTSNLEKTVGDGGSLIVDNRLPSLYEGDSGFPKPGHIPGAVNLPWTEFVMPSNPCQIRSTNYLRNMIKRVGASSGTKPILYCATGRKSAALFNIMRFLFNYDDVRLFEGSFTQWCADPKRRTTVGPKP